jgi:hypothetical protein
MVAVNNIDVRKSAVGAFAHYVVVSHLPSCGGRSLLGEAPAAVRCGFCLHSRVCDGKSPLE